MEEDTDYSHSVLNFPKKPLLNKAMETVVLADETGDASLYPEALAKVDDLPVARYHSSLIKLRLLESEDEDEMRAHIKDILQSTLDVIEFEDEPNVSFEGIIKDLARVFQIMQRIFKIFEFNSIEIGSKITKATLVEALKDALEDDLLQDEKLNYLANQVTKADINNLEEEGEDEGADDKVVAINTSIIAHAMRVLKLADETNDAALFQKSIDIIDTMDPVVPFAAYYRAKISIRLLDPKSKENVMDCVSAMLTTVKKFIDNHDVNFTDFTSLLHDLFEILTMISTNLGHFEITECETQERIDAWMISVLIRDTLKDDISQNSLNVLINHMRAFLESKGEL